MQFILQKILEVVFNKIKTLPWQSMLLELWEKKARPHLYQLAQSTESQVDDYLVDMLDSIAIQLLNKK